MSKIYLILGMLSNTAVHITPGRCTRTEPQVSSLHCQYCATDFTKEKSPTFYPSILCTGLTHIQTNNHLFPHKQINKQSSMCVGCREKRKTQHSTVLLLKKIFVWWSSTGSGGLFLFVWIFIDIFHSSAYLP